MKKTIIIALLVTVGLIILSLMARSRGNNPGIEYAPDMYVSKGYEAYTQLMEDSVVYNRFGGSMREPVKGTVALGQADYSYPFENTAEGYAQSASLAMPFIKKNGEGERLYGIYCSMCHGETGGNDGSVFKKVKTLKPGAWDNYQSDYIKNLPAGQIYHTITYGKNMMGSHAYALTPEQRWQVIDHVKYLSNPNAASNESAELSALPEFEEIEIDAAEKAALQKDFDGLNFKNGSSELLENSFASLDHVLEYLKAHNDTKPLIVKGHTDNTGDEAGNRALSKARAESVKAYLTSKGIKASNILTVGYGSSKPLVENDSEANKLKNRRVEFGFGNIKS